MKHSKISLPAARISDVIYNAANQSFEAVVTLFESGLPVKYACTLPAPITMSFREATKLLIAEARKQQKGPRGLHAKITPEGGTLHRQRALKSVTIWRKWSHSGFLRRRVA